MKRKTALDQKHDVENEMDSGKQKRVKLQTKTIYSGRIDRRYNYHGRNRNFNPFQTKQNHQFHNQHWYHYTKNNNFRQNNISSDKPYTRPYRKLDNSNNNFYRGKEQTINFPSNKFHYQRYHYNKLRGKTNGYNGNRYTGNNFSADANINNAGRENAKNFNYQDKKRNC